MSHAAAVLVIDMANDYVYPGGTIANAGGPEYPGAGTTHHSAVGQAR